MIRFSLSASRVSILLNELKLTATRSSGKGGQHVNKVSTRMEARLNLLSSQAFNKEEKDLLMQKLAKRVNQEGELFVTAQEGRSQSMNREEAIRKILALINKSLILKKARLAGGPTSASKRKRLESKKMQSEKKQERKKIEL